jgi:hypothetical protein
LLTVNVSAIAGEAVAAISARATTVVVSDLRPVLLAALLTTSATLRTRLGATQLVRAGYENSLMCERAKPPHRTTGQFLNRLPLMSVRPFGAWLLAVLVIPLAACGGAASSQHHGSGPSAAVGIRPVDMAMSLAPPNAGSDYAFEFTDRGALASGIGVDFGHGSPAKQDGAFANRLNAAGRAWVDEEPSLWHAADVQWQSTAGPRTGTPVLATGLRPAFDLAGIERKFARCHYQRRAVAGAVVYAGSGAAFQRCAGPFGDQAPSQAQIGLLTAEHIVLLSGSAAAMDGAIRKEGDLHRDAATSALVKRLAGYPAITMVSGPSFCRQISNAFIGSNPTPAFVQKALAADPPGAAYAAFAFGSRYANDRATGSIVLRYSDAQAARADLAFRAHALRTEASAQNSQPYADLLRVAAAKADGQNAVLDVTPPPSKPLGLYDMWQRLDLAFARC